MLNQNPLGNVPAPFDLHSVLRSLKIEPSQLSADALFAFESLLGSRAKAGVRPKIVDYFHLPSVSSPLARTSTTVQRGEEESSNGARGGHATHYPVERAIDPCLVVDPAQAGTDDTVETANSIGTDDPNNMSDEDLLDWVCRMTESTVVTLENPAWSPIDDLECLYALSSAWTADAESNATVPFAAPREDDSDSDDEDAEGEDEEDELIEEVNIDWEADKQPAPKSERRTVKYRDERNLILRRSFFGRLHAVRTIIDSMWINGISDDIDLHALNPVTEVLHMSPIMRNELSKLDSQAWETLDAVMKALLWEMNAAWPNSPSNVVHDVGLGLVFDQPSDDTSTEKAAFGSASLVSDDTITNAIDPTCLPELTFEDLFSQQLQSPYSSASTPYCQDSLTALEAVTSFDDEPSIADTSEQPADISPVSSVSTWSPESPILVTPENDESELPQVDEHPCTPSNYKGKAKSLSPPTPTQPLLISAQDQEVTDGSITRTAFEDVEMKEVADILLGMTASTQTSPSHLRINDNYVEGESPAGPSNARPNDEESMEMDIDDARAMHAQTSPTLGMSRVETPRDSLAPINHNKRKIEASVAGGADRDGDSGGRAKKYARTAETPNNDDGDTIMKDDFHECNECNECNDFDEHNEIDEMDVIIRDDNEVVAHTVPPSPTNEEIYHDRFKLRFLLELCHARKTNPTYRGSLPDVGSDGQFPIRCANGVVITLTPPDHKSEAKNKVDPRVDPHTGTLVHLPPPINTWHARLHPSPWIRKLATKSEEKVEKVVDEDDKTPKGRESEVRLYTEPIFLGTYSPGKGKYKTYEPAPFQFCPEKETTRLHWWHQVCGPDHKRWLRADPESVESMIGKPINVVHDQVEAWREALGNLDEGELVDYYKKNVSKEERKSRRGLKRWTPRYLRKGKKYDVRKYIKRLYEERVKREMVEDEVMGEGREQDT